MQVNLYNIKTFNPIILTFNNQNKLDLNEYGLFDTLAENIENINITTEYLDIIKTNELEIDGIKFNFTDEKWDFSSKFMKGKNKSNYVHNFKNVMKTSDYYTTLMKLYILTQLLTNGIHWCNVKINSAPIMNFITYLYENNVYTLDNLSITHLNNHFSKKEIKYRTLIKYKSAIYSFIKFHALVTNTEIDNDIEDFLTLVDSNTLKNECIAAKRKLLPQDFMMKLKDLLYSLATENPNKNTIKNRQLCGLIYICTQTGLRPSELVNLKKDCVEKAIVDGIEVYYLNYRTTKNVHGGGYTYGKTIANNKVVEIINLLSKHSNNEYLVDNIQSKELNLKLKDIVYDNAQLLNAISEKPNENFEGIPEPIKRNGKTKYINIPIMTQFRVYFASELRQRGYSEMLIARLLNHTDEKMLNYYARPASTIQEDINFSELIVKETILNNYKILGTNGEIYKNKMEEYIKDKNVNIKDDLNSIIDEICKNMPIRRKLGGYCIKANPLRACEHDSDTNEFYCAYGLCQNQCHFFYHCNYYLSLVREGQELVKFNLKKGYKQQAQKELYKLQNIINMKLIPEINELKIEMQSKGVEEIINNHNELEDFINNIEQIEEELEKWKAKKL